MEENGVNGEISGIDEGSESGGKRKDFFWLVIIVGMVVVTAGALLTGNYLARMFLNTDSEESVVVSPVDAQQPENIYTEPVTKPADEPAAKIEKPVAKEVSAPATDEKPGEKTPAQKPKTDETPTLKKDPLPAKSSEIDITGVVKTPAPKAQEVKPEEVPAVVAPAPAPDTKPVAVDPTVNAAQAEDENSIYVLQLGVYGVRENALRMKEELEKEYDLEVYVAEVIHEGEPKFRVQAGAFRNRENAEKLGRELQIKGYKFYISKQPAP